MFALKASVICELIGYCYCYGKLYGNAVLFSWKGLNLKVRNKCQLKYLKICKAVKGKHERSMVLPVEWIKLDSGELN